jgi:hypothetical protein
MMRSVLVLFLLMNAMTIFGQTQHTEREIERFKYDLMDSFSINKEDTLRWGELTLVRVKYYPVRRIKTFTKGKELIYFEQFYNGTTQLESTRFYDKSLNPYGIYKQYKKDGVLEYTIDFDKGEWIVYDQTDYPFYDFQNQMKLKADSFVVKMFGAEFLKENTIWNAEESFKYSKNGGGRWTDKHKTMPTEFLFTYSIKLDDEHIYRNIMRFKLDYQGNFIPNPNKAFLDFEFNSNIKSRFKLTYKDAMAQCKTKGLVENDSMKAVGSLRWENFSNSGFVYDQFRFYVTIKTKIIENIVPDGRSTRTSKYEIYKFDPWTGLFLEKRKMKDIFSWERRNGKYDENRTGFLPDNE